jgi:hypothetical protein
MRLSIKKMEENTELHGTNAVQRTQLSRWVVGVADTQQIQPHSGC